MEERIKKLELVTNRLLRRSKAQAVKGVITPCPISNAVFGEDVKGPVLRYMFPCIGVITKGLVTVDKKPKSGIMVDVKIENDLGSSSNGYVLVKKSSIVEPKIIVYSGDRLTVSIKSVDDTPITEVWISFLWKPTTKDTEVKKFLVEELEKDVSG